MRRAVLPVPIARRVVPAAAGTFTVAAVRYVQPEAVQARRWTWAVTGAADVALKLSRAGRGWQPAAPVRHTIAVAGAATRRCRRGAGGDGAVPGFAGDGDGAGDGLNRGGRGLTAR